MNKPLEKKFEEYVTENRLKQEIERAFAARVEPQGSVAFIPDTLSRPNVQVLTEVRPFEHQHG